MIKPDLLILDDDRGLVKEVQHALSNRFATDAVSSLAEALRIVASKEYVVVVADRRLHDTDDGPRDLLERLDPWRMRPEVVVLTGYPSVLNANELLRRGAFSYLEKASGSEIYPRLMEDCEKASRRWHQRCRRIPGSAVRDTMAVLFGDIVFTPPSVESPDIERDTEWLRQVLDAMAWKSGGYLVKLAPPTFLVICDVVASAVDVFRGVREELASRSAARFGAPLGFHAAVGWGKVAKTRMAHGDELVGPGVSETIKLLDDAVPPGELKLSLAAQTELEGRPPSWVEFALEEAARIAGASLPKDLAERHDDHSIGDPKS